MKKQFLLALVFTTAYAIIRYNGFGNVSLIHMPVYILNKGISMTAAECLFMASLCLMQAERDAVRFWTNACSQLVFVHIFLSLGILSKGYFAKFFSGDQMSLTGEVVLLTGVLAVYCIWRAQANELKAAARRTLTILTCALVSGHLFTMGYDGWLQVKKWNGGLPPITLLSFILALSSLIVFVWAKEASVSLSLVNDRVLQTEIDSL
jgi:hypothetical protein